MKRRIHNVHIMMTANDNGFCLSFWSRLEAELCAELARSEGAYHVALS